MQDNKAEKKLTGEMHVKFYSNATCEVEFKGDVHPRQIVTLPYHSKVAYGNFLRSKRTKKPVAPAAPVAPVATKTIAQKIEEARLANASVSTATNK